MSRHSTESSANRGPLVRIDPAPFEALSSDDGEVPRIVRWHDCIRRD